MDDEFGVTWSTENYLQNHGIDRVQWWANTIRNKDLVYYRNHCNGYSWGDAVDSNTMMGGPNEWFFGQHRPFLFANCCEAGRYEDVGDGGMLENSLYKGAAVYIGSTEVSPRDANNDAGRFFFEQWINHSMSIGQMFRDTKIYLSGYTGNTWSSEYNLYGDPKFGGSVTSSAAPAVSAASSSASSSVSSSGLTSASSALESRMLKQTGPSEDVTIYLPNYSITTTAEGDVLSIPDGYQDVQVGMPQTPAYPVRYQVPVGMWVKEVSLSGIGESETIHDLDLKTGAVEMDEPAEVRRAANPPDPELEEWPQKWYDWQVEETPSGERTLLITIYPLRYHPLTAEGQYIYDITLNVVLVESTASIQAVEAVEPELYPGWEQQFQVWLKGGSLPQDVILSSSIYDRSNGELVEGLPVQALDSLQGLGEVGLSWYCAGYPAGEYRLEVELRNSQGNVMDTASTLFRIGWSSGKISQPTVSQAVFAPGDMVTIGVQFQNLGNMPLTGTLIVEIQNLAGGEPIEVDQGFYMLDSKQVFDGSFPWDTTGAAAGDYLVSAYALFDSKSTEVLRADISTNWKTFLPLMKR